MKIFALLVPLFFLILPSCNDHKIPRTVVVNESSAAKLTLLNFKRILQAARLEGLLNDLGSLEELYAYDQSALGNYASEGSSWYFVDFASGKKYDYIVYGDHRNDLEEEGDILIATPCAVQVGDGIYRRIALTYDLSIIELNEDEFREKQAERFLK